MPIAYNPNKVWTSLLTWFEDGTADNESPTRFLNENDERDICFMIADLFEMLKKYAEKRKDG